MTTKSVPPGHDHSQDLTPVAEKPDKTDDKPVKPVEAVVPVNRRLPRSFKR